MGFFPLRLGSKVTDLYGSFISIRCIKKAAFSLIIHVGVEAARSSEPVFKRPVENNNHSGANRTLLSTIAGSSIVLTSYDRL